MYLLICLYLCLLSCDTAISSGSTSSNEITFNPLDGDLDSINSCVGQLVPGLDRLALGVDITKLDLYHPDYTAGAEDGFVSPVLNWHCDEGKTWTNPLNNITYLVPDEVASVESLSSGFLVSDAKVFNNLADLRASMSAEAGLDGTLITKKLGGFSASFFFRASLESIYQHNAYTAENKAQVNTHKLTLLPGFFLANNSQRSLSPAMTMYLNDKLPDSLTNESTAAYAGFFEHFGTHYFEQADFGGSLSTSITIQSELTKVMSSIRIAANVKASFLWILKSHAAFDGNIDAVDSLFTSYTSQHEHYFGGKVNPYDGSDGYHNWSPTVSIGPWLQSGRVKPLTDLLPDDHLKKRLLEEALEVYLSRAYVGEVHQSVVSALKNPASLNHKFLRDLEDQVNQSAALRIPDLDRTVLFSEQLINYTAMPDWFKLQTQVCTQFRNYGEVCSLVGVPTPPIGGWNPPLNHCPCEGSFTYHDCAQSGEMYFKAPSQETQRLLDSYGVSFELIARESYIYKYDYYQVYAGRFVVNTSIDSTITPAWLRTVRTCVRFDKIDAGVVGRPCAGGPNEWVTAEARLLVDPGYWASPVSRADSFSFHAIY